VMDRKKSTVVYYDPDMTRIMTVRMTVVHAGRIHAIQFTSQIRDTYKIAIINLRIVFGQYDPCMYPNLA